MYRIVLPILICLLGISIIGCDGDSNKTKTPEKDQNIPKEIYPMSTPFEITQMLEKAGASFILDLMNPVENVDKYLTDKNKALNLGVYGADISYSSTYNNAPETRKIMAATKKLSDELGITTLLNKSIMERAEANMENKDSLYKIVTESFSDNFTYLNKNNKGHLAVLILTGSWVEGLYLATNLAKTSKESKTIVLKIGEQKLMYNGLIELLDKQKNHPDVADVINEVAKLKPIFDQITIEEDLVKISDAQFEAIAKNITEIRTKLVTP